MVGCLFVLLVGSFAMQQLLNLMKSHLFIFAFVVLQIETILFLPFSICMSFISFSCLITMLGLPVSPMLIRSLETGYLCLVPDFRRKNFLSLFDMMLAVDFLYMTFIMLRYVSSIPTLLRVFIRNGCWILQMLFLYCWYGHILFILHFVNVLYWLVCRCWTIFLSLK